MLHPFISMSSIEKLQRLYDLIEQYDKIKKYEPEPRSPFSLANTEPSEKIDKMQSKCDEGNLRFLFRRDRNKIWHMESHIKFACSKCERQFDSSRAMKVHLYQAHNRVNANNKGLSDCEFCDKKYFSMKGSKRHIIGKYHHLPTAKPEVSVPARVSLNPMPWSFSCRQKLTLLHCTISRRIWYCKLSLIHISEPTRPY